MKNLLKQTRRKIFYKSRLKSADFEPIYVIQKDCNDVNNRLSVGHHKINGIATITKCILPKANKENYRKFRAVYGLYSDRER